MDDLARWLDVQLDEDERIARAAPGPAWEHRQIRGDFDESVVFEDYIAVADPERNTVVFSEVDPEVLPFALRYDPDRILREIDAKRLLLDRYKAFHWHGPAAPTSPDPRDHVEDTGACRTCITMRILALPYADRPGYRAKWALTSPR